MKYKLIKSHRKTLSLSVNSNLEVVVKAPKRVSNKDIEKFIKDNTNWIQKSIEEANKRNIKLSKINYDPKLKKQYKSAILKYATQKANEISNLLNVEIKRVKLSSAKGRWGSCSSKKNVNINWKLIFAPKVVINYVILHEVCHLKHMNHSKDFWDLVKTHDSDYKEHKKWLNANSHILMLE